MTGRGRWIVPAAAFALVGLAALAAGLAPRIAERRQSTVGAGNPASGDGTVAATGSTTTEEKQMEQSGTEQPPTEQPPAGTARGNET